jgi:hypothetical protein
MLLIQNIGYVLKNIYSTQVCYKIESREPLTQQQIELHVNKIY